MLNESYSRKEFYNLASFSKEIIVCCPHCKSKAYIFTTLGQYTVPYPNRNRSTFRCNNCYKPIDEKRWYGPIIIFPVNRKCGYCGHDLKAAKRVRKYQNRMKVRCSSCEQEKLYPTQYTVTYASDTQATDPYYGLELWLQISVDNNIFWAYNYEHLEYLKQYVAARLREARFGGKYSLAWKLPNFIKVAKNRDKILKVIDKLEKKI